MSYPPPNTFDPFDPHGHEEAYHTRMDLLRRRTTSSAAMGGTKRRSLNASIPPRSSRYTGRQYFTHTMPAKRTTRKTNYKNRTPYRPVRVNPRSVVSFSGGNFPRTIVTTMRTHCNASLATNVAQETWWLNTRLLLSNLESPWVSASDPGYNVNDTPRALDKMFAIWKKYQIQEVTARVTFACGTETQQAKVFVLPSKEPTTLTTSSATQGVAPYSTINDMLEAPRIKWGVVTNNSQPASTKIITCKVTPSNLYGHRVGIENEAFVGEEGTPPTSPMYLSVGIGGGLNSSTGAAGTTVVLVDIALTYKVRFFDRDFEI